MLSAKRISDGETVYAYFESKRNGPFRCLQCNEEVILKSGRHKINHFAHANPLACEYAAPESDDHLRCKLELFEGLRIAPGVSEVVLERPCGNVRPDVSATIRGVKVAIEIQISALSVEAILARTIAYHQKGIYVLWLLHSPPSPGKRYSPPDWQRWLHACYFGRVYYWIGGLDVVEYRFEPEIKTIPRKTWVSARGKKVSVGGHAVRSIRYRRPERGKTFNLATDFGPRLRYWWEGGGIKVPDAKLFMERTHKNN